MLHIFSTTCLSRHYVDTFPCTLTAFLIGTFSSQLELDAHRNIELRCSFFRKGHAHHSCKLRISARRAHGGNCGLPFLCSSKTPSLLLLLHNTTCSHRLAKRHLRHLLFVLRVCFRGARFLLGRLAFPFQGPTLLCVALKLFPRVSLPFAARLSLSHAVSRLVL